MENDKGTATSDDIPVAEDTHDSEYQDNNPTCCRTVTDEEIALILLSMCFLPSYSLSVE